MLEWFFANIGLFIAQQGSQAKAATALEVNQSTWGGEWSWVQIPPPRPLKNLRKPPQTKRPPGSPAGFLVFAIGSNWVQSGGAVGSREGSQGVGGTGRGRQPRRIRSKGVPYPTIRQKL